MQRVFAKFLARTVRVPVTPVGFEKDNRLHESRNRPRLYGLVIMPYSLEASLKRVVQRLLLVFRPNDASLGMHRSQLGTLSALLFWLCSYC